MLASTCLYSLYAWLYYMMIIRYGQSVLHLRPLTLVELS